MILVDVHAHLDDYNDAELRVVMENCKKVGVEVIISNGTDPRSNRTCLKVAEMYKEVYSALGLYPTKALEMDGLQILEELNFIAKSKDRIVAIGEVGLDYYWVQGKNKEQQEVFSKLIKLAEKLNKPIIVHSRKAEEDVITMLESSKIKHIIMHCFGGKLSLTKRCRDYGWKFSIPTNIVRSSHFQRIVEEVPIFQLLTETDSPYLGPVMGKRNEPCNVVEVVKKIAEIKKLDVEECSKMVYMNYQRLF